MSEKPTMRLAEYIEQEEADSNLFWRLQGGDHLNLLDEAISIIEDRDAEIERLREYIEHQRQTIREMPWLEE